MGPDRDSFYWAGRIVNGDYVHSLDAGRKDTRRKIVSRTVSPKRNPGSYAGRLSSRLNQKSVSGSWSLRIAVFFLDYGQRGSNANVADAGTRKGTRSDEIRAQ